MAASLQRRDDEPAFVLHTYPYRETSLIVETFSAHFGRVALVAKGAKRPRSELRGLLNGFQPLTLSWAGQGELKTLLKAEWRGGLALVGGSALLCGFYLNELLLKLLPREDPHPRLFDRYATTLERLAAGAGEALTLRQFELTLLSELGYGLQLTTDADTRSPIDPAARYYYVFDRGPRRQVSQMSSQVSDQTSGQVSDQVHDQNREVREATPIRYPHVRGSTLLALAHQDFAAPESAGEAKLLMREVLNHYLERKSIFSRRVVRDLAALDEPEANPDD